jgi:hypothetical protein
LGPIDCRPKKSVRPPDAGSKWRPLLRGLTKLNLKKAQIVDIQKAITTADVNNDKRFDFIEWRNNLRVY